MEYRVLQKCVQQQSKEHNIGSDTHQLELVMLQPLIGECD